MAIELVHIPEIEKKVEIVLEIIRPYLQIDGGDIELVSVTQDGYVEVRLLGSCKDCALKPMTLRAGIERAIMHSIPGIKRIEAVN